MALLTTEPTVMLPPSRVTVPKAAGLLYTCKPDTPVRLPLSAMRRAAPGFTITAPVPSGVPLVPVTWREPASTAVPPV